MAARLEPTQKSFNIPVALAGIDRAEEGVLKNAVKELRRRVVEEVGAFDLSVQASCEVTLARDPNGTRRDIVSECIEPRSGPCANVMPGPAPGNTDSSSF